MKKDVTITGRNAQITLMPGIDDVAMYVDNTRDASLGVRVHLTTAEIDALLIELIRARAEITGSKPKSGS